MAKARFGNIGRLPSGNYQARYKTDGGTVEHRAPTTFVTKCDAEMWLATIRADRSRGVWLSEEVSGLTLAQYAESWLADRTLKPRTREHYRQLLANQVLPTLGRYRLEAIYAGDGAPVA